MTSVHIHSFWYIFRLCHQGLQGLGPLVGWPQAIKLRKVSTLWFWTEMVSKPVGNHTMITVSQCHTIIKSCTTSTYMYHHAPTWSTTVYFLTPVCKDPCSLPSRSSAHSPGRSRPYLQGNQGFEALQPHLTTSCCQILCPESPFEDPETKKHCNRSWVKLIKHYLNILYLRGELL